MLHGLAAESLHAFLVRAKKQAESNTSQPARLMVNSDADS